MRRAFSLVLLVGMGCFGTATVHAQEGTTEPAPTAPIAMNEAQIAQHFAGEPSLPEVYRMAQQQVGLDPSRIDKWFSKSGKKYLFPQLQAHYRTEDGFSDTLSFRQDPDRVIIGPRDETDQKLYEVQAVWDLRELIFDRQSKRDIVTAQARMLRMQADLLGQVSEIYYERRRHQLELLVDPPASPVARLEKQLRVDELTGQLDVLTGGKFSGHAGGGGNP
jgi:hypothetical protein